jgi:hypothetical protein
MFFLAACNSLPSLKTPPTPAASASAWSKPGADPAAVERVYGECLDAVNTVTDKDFNIDQDIAAGRGGDFQRSNFGGTSVRDSQQYSSDRAQTMLSSCMRAQGFTTGP